MSLFMHVGIGLTAKPVLPKTNVWLLIGAAFAPDMLSKPMQLVGLASHNPFIAAAISIAIGLPGL
jgi:hypothetical protein